MPIPDFDPDRVPDPTLPPGVYQATTDEIHERFVVQVPSSLTRDGIFRKWILFRTQLRRIVPVRLEYVDGSYVSGRRNPRDMDLSLWIGVDDLNGLAPGERQVLLALWAQRISTFSCDAYIVPECPPGHPGYGLFESMAKCHGEALEGLQGCARERPPGC